MKTETMMMFNLIRAMMETQSWGARRIVCINNRNFVLDAYSVGKRSKYAMGRLLSFLRWEQSLIVTELSERQSQLMVEQGGQLREIAENQELGIIVFYDDVKKQLEIHARKDIYRSWMKWLEV